MFNVGGPEVLVILLVALVVLGPKELPKAMRSVGKAMAELRKISSGFQAELQNALDPTTPATARPQLGNATTMEQADITETIARAEPGEAPVEAAPTMLGANPAVPEPASEGPDVTVVTDRFSAPASAVDENPQVRAINPVDRAAG